MCTCILQLFMRFWGSLHTGVIRLKKKTSEELEQVLSNWSKDVDPAVLAGDEWSDAAELAEMNKEGDADFRERPRAFGAMFTHPTHDASYNNDQE